MTELISPKDFTPLKKDGTPHQDAHGNPCVFILSNFPAVQGREIITKYPTAALPKIGDYAVSEDVMVKLMNYVAVRTPAGELRLSTTQLINNHCPDWEVLAKVEMAMMEKNCSFFRDGRSWDFLENVARIFSKKFSETLISLSERLSQPEKPA